MRSECRDRRTALDGNEIEAIKVTQEIIKRMADNSQKIKGFFLGTFALVLALIVRENVNVSCKMKLAFTLVAVVFWYMDARYLQLEKRFREHHRGIVDGVFDSLDRWDFYKIEENTQKIPSVCGIMATFSTSMYPAIIIVMWIIAF